MRYCNRCGQRYEKRRPFGYSCDACEAYACQVDAEYVAVELAVFEATTEAFWSGVRACMLVEARRHYQRKARIISVAIRINDLCASEEWAFWDAVTELQLLGEVGGEP